MKSRNAKVRHYLEWWLLLGLTGVARCLGESARHGFARALGCLVWWLFRSRQRVVRDNLALAYPDPATRPSVDAIGKASMTNLFESFLELFLMPNDPEVLRRRIRQTAGPKLETLGEAYGPGPFIWAAAHFGAWEVLGSCGPLLGYNLTSLVRPLDNPHLQAWVAARRSRFGAELVSKYGGLLDILAALDRGRQVAILSDLNYRGRSAEFPVYFGVPAATSRTLAVVALKSGRPVVPVFCHRKSYTCYEIELGTPIVPNRSADHDAEVRRILQEIATAIETRVRASPTSWLWTHRRWKSRPKESVEGGDATV